MYTDRPEAIYPVRDQEHCTDILRLVHPAKYTRLRKATLSAASRGILSRGQLCGLLNHKKTILFGGMLSAEISYKDMADQEHRLVLQNIRAAHTSGERSSYTEARIER